MGYDLDYLLKPKHRIEWDAFCQILANARELYTLEQLSDLNEAFMRSPFFSYVGVVARFLFNSRDLFDWICKRSVGGGAQLFGTCVRPTYEHIGDDATVIRLEIAKHLRSSEEFFWMSRGSFIAMPRLVGSGSADVDMSIDGNDATYHIKYKVKRGTFSAVVRWFTWPFAVRSAARELKRTNEELQGQYYELAAARDQLEEQALLLRTAHAINDRIHGDLDLDRTLVTVTKALVEEGRFAAAEIRLPAQARVVQTGELGEAVIERALQTLAGAPLGTLVVSDGADRARSEELLALVAPTIALAIDNARAYHELADYKTGLETLVAKRTEELASTVDQLREAQGARQKFFGNISHEFRTPLSLVILAAGDIEQRAGAALDPRAKQSLVAVTDAARRLLRLVDELLLLAAGQENKLVLHRAPSDVAAILRSLFGGWQPAAERAGLTLAATLPATLVALVDPVAIERIASNLISNAVKYTPSGGRVELVLTDDAQGPRLSVLDTGKGIDADLAKRLFGRFERAATASEQAVGSGIGLSLVKQLVEAHGGTIEALPREGGGTEMRAQFPADLRTSLVAEVSEAKLSGTGRIPTIQSGKVFPARGLSEGTILVAEDDPNLAERIAELLSEHYKVVVGLDGEAALALVPSHQPQLLITDVEMPRMNGIELARRFRETTNDKLAPIVILSAVTDLGTRVAGLDAGAVDYVGKPFDPRELEARVRSQFRMRELAVRLHRAEQVSTLGILTSGLAHELRNPANGIVNAIQPIKEMLPADVNGGVLALLEVLHDCADQIGFMSRQLLGFRGGTGLELQQAKTTELVSRAASLAQRSLAGVELRTHLVLERSVMCAPHLMVQVLTNLVENGAHAAGKGGWVEVRVARSSETGTTIFEVSDSGGGVPVNLRDRIFEPFFTTKPQGVGTGLGLSVARAIIDRHHGKIEVRERGPRTAFVIELPDTEAA